MTTSDVAKYVFPCGFGTRDLLGGYLQISTKVSSCRTHAMFLTVQNVQDALVYGNCDVDRTQIRLVVQSRHKTLGVLMESAYEAFQNAEMENWLDQTPVVSPLLACKMVA